jgi:hypothetical protein
MVIRQTVVLGILCAALLTSSIGSAQASRVNQDRDPEQMGARIATATSYTPRVDARNFDLKSDTVPLTPIGSPPRIKLAGTGRI